MKTGIDLMSTYYNLALTAPQYIIEVFSFNIAV